MVPQMGRPCRGRWSSVFTKNNYKWLGSCCQVHIYFQEVAKIFLLIPWNSIIWWISHNDEAISLHVYVEFFMVVASDQYLNFPLTAAQKNRPFYTHPYANYTPIKYYGYKFGRFHSEVTLCWSGMVGEKFKKFKKKNEKYINVERKKKKYFYTRDLKHKPQSPATTTGLFC